MNRLDNSGPIARTTISTLRTVTFRRNRNWVHRPSRGAVIQGPVRLVSRPACAGDLPYRPWDFQWIGTSTSFN
jgi:hypothetical protein